MANLYGNEIATNVRRSLVYQATHIGEDFLPYMNRSFISFTYGGKKIEEFDLIATVSGDRMNFNAYATFNDTVTAYDNLDGLNYWATHYQTHQIDFTLSTDGIDDRQLNNFKHWFKAGISRELILAEHPNRAIMARVVKPPVINMIPFEHKINAMISGNPYATKTTLYKGDILLSLIMDLPHWYAIQNILGTEDRALNRYIDEWIDANGNHVDIFASEDALKILYEDGIPLGSMIQKNILLGNGMYANVENDDNGKIWTPAEAEIVWFEGEPSEKGARIAGIITYDQWLHNSHYIIVTEDYRDLITTENGEKLTPDHRLTNSADEGAILTNEVLEPLSTETDQDLITSGHLAYKPDYHDYLPGEYKGKIAGPIVDISGEGIKTLMPNEYGYFFYSGTAPAPTIISFTLTPKFIGNYISEPCNSYASETGNKYNTFTVESLTQQDLLFTTPNIYTSYNMALRVFENYAISSNSWEKVREALRDTIRHPKVREYAIYILNNALNGADDDANVTVQYISLLNSMKKFFIGNGETAKEASFTFNSKTGEATGIFSYYPDGLTLLENLKENVGDMLRSNYIFILDRNYSTDEGVILHWADTNDITKLYSHRIYHDVSGGLSKVQVLYKNMYL